MNIEEMKNAVICGDCLDVMKDIPDKSIDLVLTDPPYGIGNNVTYRKNNLAKLTKTTDYGKYTWNNSIPKKEIFDEVFRISKNQIIFGANYFIENMPINSSCWLVWDKDNPKSPFADCELAWTSFKTKVVKYIFRWNGMIQENMKNKEKRYHPTQKPVELFRRILSDYSKEGQIVLDCFAGSGTTALACHDLKRNFICIEKDPEYHAIATKRYNEAKAQLRLF